MTSSFTSLLSQKPLFDFACSLYPQAVFILATLILLNTYLPEKQPKRIILLILFKAEKKQAHLLWGMSSGNTALTASSPPSLYWLPISTTPLQSTQILLNETDMYRLSCVFITQKGRIILTKVTEKRRIIESFSLLF